MVREQWKEPVGDAFIYDIFLAGDATALPQAPHGQAIPIAQRAASSTRNEGPGKESSPDECHEQSCIEKHRPQIRDPGDGELAR